MNEIKHYYVIFFNFQKYFGYILTNEIRLEDKHFALFSTLDQKQNLHLVLDFVFAYHKAIDDAYV